MHLKVLPYDLTVCKTADTAALDLTPLPAPLHARTVGAAFA